MIEFPCGRAKDKRSVTKTIFMVICDVIATLFECSAHARHLNILQFFHIFFALIWPAVRDLMDVYVCDAGTSRIGCGVSGSR